MNKKSYIVIINSTEMGSGDLTIGEKLIKAYLHTLSELDDTKLPDKIFFYNTGIFLAMDDADNFEDLKILKDRGVELYACGSCTDYFKVESNNVSLTTIATMKDFAEMMADAEKIITP